MDDVYRLGVCVARYEPELWLHLTSLGFHLSTVFYGARKGTNGVSSNGVTANFIFFDRGTFGVLPLTYFYLPQSARVYLFQQSVKNRYFCAAAALVLTPLVRSQRRLHAPLRLPPADAHADPLLGHALLGLLAGGRHARDAAAAQPHRPGVQKQINTAKSRPP